MTQQASGLNDPQGRHIDYLRVSVTDRCNYRCTYCMPEDGVEHTARGDVLSFEEIIGLVGGFAELGVRRVRITGGEPTVRKDIVNLVAMISAIPGIDDIALSTNGHRLAELAGPLRAAGVQRLNVSLDSLVPERFARITRRGNLEDVLAGLMAAKAVGYASIKLNAVAVKGFNDDEVASLCDFAWTHGFVPRFIEQMPMMEGELFVPGAMMTAQDVRNALLSSHVGAELVPDREAALGAGPARYWRLQEVKRESSLPVRRLGLITPITEHFCDTCNRVRLSSAGALHTCLAHDDAVDLRKALLHGGVLAVKEAILAAVATKKPSHLFQLNGKGGPRKSMVQIGG
jgi:GTP 3',8-cyclase